MKYELRIGFIQKIRSSEIVNRNFKSILRLVDGLMTMIKYTAGFLTKIEDIVSESDYILRYENNYILAWKHQAMKRDLLFPSFPNIRQYVTPIRANHH